jgi:tartrate-resistant acid phosphatase type 5
MNEVATEYQSKFVMTVGDNFYDNGTASTIDPIWKTLWIDIYKIGYLGSLQWWAVLGNRILS